MYNIVAVDPSLISTALVVSHKDSFRVINYCRESKVYGKTGMTKWFKMAEEHVEYKFIEYRTFDGYSEGELVKLKDYDKITDQIISDILESINPEIPTKIGIEGYNFGAQVGDLIDLVTFSTLLRKKLFDKVSEDILVISPSTLKLECCKLTYPPINEGKKKEKWVYKNNNGISGGSFTKHEILLSIIENKNINDDWSKLCVSLKSEMMGLSLIPKPFEDINDAVCLFYILKGNK